MGYIQTVGQCFGVPLAMALAVGVWAPAIPTAEVTRLTCTADGLAEIEIRSTEPFPVRNALTEFQAGDVDTFLSRYGDDGDTHTLIFSVTRDDLLRLSPDISARVLYNPSNGQDIWRVEPFDPAAVTGCGNE